MQRFRILFAVGATAALVVAAGWLGWSSSRPKTLDAQRKPQTVRVTRGDVQQSVTAPGRLEATRKASLGFSSQGKVVEVRVGVGEAVRRGQTLAVLDRAPLRRQLTDARAALKAARRDHDDRVAAAELELASARAEYAAAPPSATAERSRLKMAVAKAELQLRSLVAQGVDPKLRQAVHDAQDALDGAVLTAPFDGVVTEINVAVGDGVQPGQAVLTVVDLASLEVRATITEQDYPLLRVGLRASLFMDAAPDADVAARISRIVPQRAEGDRTLFPVYLSMDALPKGAAIGMTVDASIIVAERQAVLTLPRELVRTGGSGKAVLEVWTNGHREQRTVTVGLRGDTNVEILSGLREGDEVVAE